MYECLFGMFPSRCGSGIRDDFRTAEPLALTLRVRSPDFTPPSRRHDGFEHFPNEEGTERNGNTSIPMDTGFSLLPQMFSNRTEVEQPCPRDSVLQRASWVCQLKAPTGIGFASKLSIARMNSCETPSQFLTTEAE